VALSHPFGPLEMQVLGLLDPHEPLSVAQVQERLQAAGHESAYTTVMTVLTRLHAKKAVVRNREGNRYLYTAAARAPKVKAGLLARLQRSLFQGDRAQPVLALLEGDELSDAELRELRRLIDAKLRARKP
jgi:predicted transcriptional regulator